MVRVEQSTGRAPRPARRLRAVASLLVLVAVSSFNHRAVAQGTPRSARIRLDPQYHAPGCEPIPSVPTVGRWFARTTLDYQQLAATSADCGQVGGAAAAAPREGRLPSGSRAGRVTANGWTYILWSEETAVAGVLRKVGRALGLTRLVMKRPEEAHTVRAAGEGAFFLLQLDGDEAKPLRVWAAGDVKSLKGSIAMAHPEGVELSIESVAHSGERCRALNVAVLMDRADGPTVELPCG